jgi:hypothetical protein
MTSSLPKFIYLLGHDLILPRQPERTMATIEIANNYGIKAVKDMQSMLGSGATLDAVLQRYPVKAAPVPAQQADASPHNRVLVGNTGQLDAQQAATPTTRINVSSILAENALAAAPERTQTTTH